LDYVDTSPAAPLADSSNSTSESGVGMKNGRSKGRAKSNSSSSNRYEDDEEFDLPIGTEGSLRGVDRGIFEHTTTGASSDRLNDPCTSDAGASAGGARGTAPPSKASHTILIYNKIHSMHNPPPADVIAESETVLPAVETTSIIARSGAAVTVDSTAASSTPVVVNETQGAKVVGNVSTSVDEGSVNTSSVSVHSAETVAVIPAVASAAHVPVEIVPVVSNAEQEVSAFWDEPVRAAPAAAVSVALASAVTAPPATEPSEAPAPTSPAIVIDAIPGAQPVTAMTEEQATLASVECDAVDATAVAECREEGSSPSTENNNTSTLAARAVESTADLEVSSDSSA
jgi:hypothetical protein